MLLGSQRTLLKGAPAMAQIILDHVEKAYPGGVKAVDGLSLDIADGEFIVRPYGIFYCGIAGADLGLWGAVGFG